MFLKKFISYETKVKTRLFLMRFQSNPFFSKEQLTIKRRVFVFLAADYSNLGDVAITYAHNNFLTQNFPDYQVFEIPISQTIEGLHFVSSNIQSGDVVTTVGGGNFGNLYADIEFLRELVVSAFPNNKVVIFPLTYDFSNDAEGQKALAKTKSVYDSHSDVTIIAREAVSYELIKKAFTGSKVLLTPDIVMSLDKTLPKVERNGVVLALRSDKEKRLTESEDVVLSSLINSHFQGVKSYDTHLGRGNLSPTERVDELNAIWNAFRSAKLVITDRLHGMIFCYITNTPCIVFMNNNHKISTSHEWIQHSNSIFLVTEFSKERTVELFQMINNQVIEGNYANLSAKYQPILDAFKR